MPDRSRSPSQSWTARSGTAFRSLLNTFFPPVCVRCQQVGDLLCAQCRQALPYLAEPTCARCGRPTRQATLRCHNCRQQPLPLVQIKAVLHFEEPVPHLIHQLKYEDQPALAEPLAQVMADHWPIWPIPIDLVLPIPLHRERERKRGYNQSALLVKHLCRQRRLPTQARALERRQATRPQVGLDAVNRQKNVVDAFQAVPDRVRGRHVLLVDDVCTTGATLAAAADALLAAGATQVAGYCLARAQ